MYTASNGKLGGAWERGYHTAYLHHMFPGPAQLPAAYSMYTASNGKLGGAWERGYLHHEEESKSSDVKVPLCSEDVLCAAQL